MKIAVIGAGGVGGYFGARLAAAENEVTFVARGAQLAAMQQHGLEIRSARGNLHLQPVSVLEDIAKLPPVDLILLTVKLWDTEEVARALRPSVDRGASVLSLQNGVEKEDVLRKHLPAEAVLGGLCYIAATIASPGVIEHTGTMQRLVFGSYTAPRTPLTDQLLAACQRAAIDAEVTDSIDRRIWEKFVFLIGLSATTATMQQPIGPIRENPETRSFLLDVMREVVTLGRARGVDLSEDFAENRLTFCDTLPPTMTSSMHNDLERGSRLELPWLSGGVARLADAISLPTPLNRAVAAILALRSTGKLS